MNWVKIDVEGAELEVLKGGATDLLSTGKDIALLIEIHGKGNLSSGDRFSELLYFERIMIA